MMGNDEPLTPPTLTLVTVEQDPIDRPCSLQLCRIETRRAAVRSQS